MHGKTSNQRHKVNLQHKNGLKRLKETLTVKNGKVSILFFENQLEDRGCFDTCACVCVLLIVEFFEDFLNNDESTKTGLT